MSALTNKWGVLLFNFVNLFWEYNQAFQIDSLAHSMTLYVSNNISKSRTKLQL